MSTLHKSTPIEVEFQVLEGTLGLDDSYLKRCETFIRQEGDRVNHASNLKCNMTDWQFIMEHFWFQQFLDKLNIVVKKTFNLPLVLDSAWGATYAENEYAAIHDHARCIWSFVYFVKAEKGSPPLSFFKTITKFKNEIDNIKQQEPILNIPAEKDKLILFPGAVPHGVYPNKSGAKRVVIAGNYGL